MSNTKVGNKIKKILQEGVRRNTHKPVSGSNPRRAVPQKQAVAIALSMQRRGQLKKGRTTYKYKGKTVYESAR